MKELRTAIALIVVAFSVFLSGCAFNPPSERYVSPHIEGVSQRINLEEVQKAFWESKGKDLNSWMSAFEKRVNEIYEGKEVVSVDAVRQKGHLVVTGFIDTQKKEGFVAGDDKLFSIEQTGDAVNNEMPYRVSGQDGSTFYQGSHSFLDNPFLQMMLISHMMGGFGPRYYTPYDRTAVLQGYRNTYRATPSWTQQQTSNRQFDTRFKSKPFGDGLQSRTGFGSSNFSTTSAQPRRSWGGFGSTSSTTTSSGSTSLWGGRRSSGFGSSFGSSRGWGGRRR
jgi:hypothetical protein